MTFVGLSGCVGHKWQQPKEDSSHQVRCPSTGFTPEGTCRATGNQGAGRMPAWAVAAAGSLLGPGTLVWQ